MECKAPAVSGLADSLLSLRSGFFRALASRRGRTAKLADLLRRLLQPAIYSAPPGRPHERQESGAEMGISGAVAAEVREHSPGCRRDYVSHAVAQRHRSAGCQDRPGILDLSLRHVSRVSPLLRDRESWRGYPRRHIVHGYR